MLHVSNLKSLVKYGTQHRIHYNNCLLFQPFKKFAQIGRVIYINEGQYKGKLAVIVDIIDTNRVSIIPYFAVLMELSPLPCTQKTVFFRSVLIPKNHKIQLAYFAMIQVH